MRSKGIILTTSYWPHHPMSMSHSSTVASTLKYHPGVTISRSCGQFCIMVELKKKIKIRKEKLNLNWVPKKILKATGVILATLLVECWLLYNKKKKRLSMLCAQYTKFVEKGFLLTVLPYTPIRFMTQTWFMHLFITIPAISKLLCLWKCFLCLLIIILVHLHVFMF